jgi:PAS domain S-box-containing protein
MNKTTTMPTVQQLTILVIDDSAEDRAMYRRYLQRSSAYDYHILEADLAVVGLDLCQRSLPNLVLLDYSLPDMDGLECLAQLQQQTGKRRVPVLMLTGQGNEMIAAQAIKSGAQDYLIKGKLTADGLCKALDHLIEQFQLQQQLEQQQQQQQMLGAIALRIRQSLNLQTILNTSVLEVRECLAADRVLVYQFASDMSGQVVAEAVLPEWLASLHSQIEETCFYENLGIADQQGKIYAIADIYDAGLTDCQLQLLERFQVKANLVIPLLITEQSSNGTESHAVSALPQLWGLLIIHQCSNTRQWQTFETDLLNQVAVQMAIAIQQAELYDQLQQLNQTLETRVQERTVALQTSEARLREAQRIAHLGDWTFDLATQEITWSEEVFRLFGCDASQGEPTYTEHLQSYAPESRQQLESAVQQAVALGESYELELQIVRPDRSMAWILSQGEPVQNCQGEIVRLLGTALDITDRKQTAIALQHINELLEQRVQQRTQELTQSEERLRLALMAANQGLYDLNLKTGETIVSPEYASMLGYEPDTFQESNAQWLERLHPNDLESVAATYRAYTTGEITDYQVEFRQRTQNGQWKWILSLGQIVAWDETGQPLRMLGTHTDIDDRKQAEQDLQESRNMLKLVLDTIPQRVFWKDRQSRFIGCNSAFANDYQLTIETIIGKTDLELPWAEWAHLYQDNDAEVMKTLIPKLGYEEPTSSVSGEQIWVRSSKIPLTNSQGDLIGVIGCYDDITGLKQAEAALQQLNAELEQRVSDRTVDLQQAMEAAKVANQAKSTFLANMSHELRTPLNVILGFTQLMRRDTALGDDQQDYIHIMHRNGEHLLHLINDVLDLSKIEAGCITLENTSTDLFELLCDLQEMFRERADAKGLQFNLELAHEIPQYIITDPHKLRQVLINLLNNAIKFTHEGRVILRVSWESGRVGESGKVPTLPSTRPPLSLVFEVEDTGVGIAPAELATIFDAFTQAEAGRISLEGTGLGLTISRRLVRLMEGTLTVRSTLSKGSTFGFSIPLRPAPAIDVPKAVNKGQVMGLASDQPAYRILVVDDHPDNRQLLVRLLTQIGLAVQEAASGEDAIARWQTWHPHLIWMDMRMADMDGCEITRRIRAQEAVVMAQLSRFTDKEAQQGNDHEPRHNDQPMTKIIAITAQTAPHHRARALAAGCDDFVTKPIQVDVILTQMADQLGLCYHYQATDDEQQTANGNSQETAFTSASSLMIHTSSLQIMPPTWIADLHQAALNCDDEATTLLIQQIPAEHRALSEYLNHWLHNYRFEVIVRLTQPHTPPTAP